MYCWQPSPWFQRFWTSSGERLLGKESLSAVLMQVLLGQVPLKHYPVFPAMEKGGQPLWISPPYPCVVEAVGQQFMLNSFLNKEVIKVVLLSQMGLAFLCQVLHHPKFLLPFLISIFWNQKVLLNLSFLTQGSWFMSVDFKDVAAMLFSSTYLCKVLSFKPSLKSFYECIPLV